MIGKTVEQLLLENDTNFVIPADNVASLLDIHPLNHALLVLTKTGYSKIPVVTTENEFVGLIGLSSVVNEMFDLTDVDSDNLEGKQVKDVVITDIPTLCEPYNVEDILHLLVNNPFIPVIDEQNHFLGILTRRELIKSVNHLAHELETRYDVTEKDTQKKKSKAKLESL